MTRLYKKINEQLKKDDKAEKVDVVKLSDQICNRLGLPYQELLTCNFVAKKMLELELLQGKSPDTLAGVAVFIGSQLSKSKNSFETIATSMKKKALTLKSAYKEVQDELRSLVPEKLRSSIGKLP